MTREKSVAEAACDLKREVQGRMYVWGADVKILLADWERLAARVAELEADLAGKEAGHVA